MNTNNYFTSVKQLLYKGELNRLTMPIEIYLEVTNVCEMGCIYCYKTNLNNGKSFLSLKLLKKLLIEIKNAVSTPILFVLEGGEPLLHPNFDEIVYLIKKNNHCIDIITNGLLLDDEKICSMYDYFDIYKDEIQISLDGLSQENYKNRNIPGDIVIEKIKYLNSKKIIPRINSVITKYNCDEILSFLRFLSNEVDISSVTLSSVIGKKNMNLQAPLEKRRNLSIKLKEENLNFQIYENFLHKNCYSIKCTERFAEHDDYHRRCTALTGKISVSTDGYVYPCVFYENHIKPIGDLNEDSLERIWNSKLANEFIIWKNDISENCTYCKQNLNCTQICAGGIF